MKNDINKDNNKKVQHDTSLTRKTFISGIYIAQESPGIQRNESWKNIYCILNEKQTYTN